MSENQNKNNKQEHLENYKRLRSFVAAVMAISTQLPQMANAAPALLQKQNQPAAMNVESLKTQPNLSFLPKIPDTIPIPTIIDTQGEIQKYANLTLFSLDSKPQLPGPLSKALLQNNLGKKIEFVLDQNTHRIVVNGNVLPGYEGTSALKNAGSNFFEKLAMNIILRSDVTRLKSNLDKDGNITIGDGISLRIENNASEFDKSKFEIPNYRSVILSEADNSDPNSLTPTGTGTIIQEEKTQILLTADHNFRNHLKLSTQVIPDTPMQTGKTINVSYTTPNLGNTYRIETKETFIITAGNDIAFVVPKSKEGLDLALKTLEQMYQAAQLSRTQPNINVAISTFKTTQTKDTFQPSPYLIPGKLNFDKGPYNYPLGKNRTSQALGVRESQITTDQANGYFGIGGISGSTIIVNINGQPLPIGVFSAGNQVPTSEQTEFKDPWQAVSIVDPPELLSARAQISRYFNQLGKEQPTALLQQSLTPQSEILTSTKVIKNQLIVRSNNLLGHRILAGKAIAKPSDSITILEIEKAFQNHLKFQEQVPPLVATIIKYYSEYLNSLPKSARLKAYENTNMVQASKQNKTEALGQVMGLVKQELIGSGTLPKDT